MKKVLRTLQIATATLLALGLAVPAHAVEPTSLQPDAYSTSSSVIDIDARGTLTITKQPVQEDAPVAYSHIEIAQVLRDAHGNAIDLTTDAGWRRAAALSANQVTDEMLGAGIVQITEEDGIAKFANLPLGLYLVTEIEPPVGQLAFYPFFVTIPMTNPAGDGWMYEVSAFPKNQPLVVDPMPMPTFPVITPSPTPTPTPTQPPAEGPGMAVTGAEIMPWVIGGGGVLIVALVLVSFRMKRKES